MRLTLVVNFVSVVLTIRLHCRRSLHYTLFLSATKIITIIRFLASLKTGYDYMTCLEHCDTEEASAPEHAKNLH